LVTTKRIIDIAVSSAVLVISAPLFLLIAMAIKLDDPGPVFFRQKRVGRNRSNFEIFKFRTMVIDAENKGAGVFVEEDDPRITRVGKILRSTSLDELPQLINVFRGEMSLVGPRPTLAYQVEKYDQEQLRRLMVKPGVTGWAQVNGRNMLTWPERIKLDLWYIDNWTLWLDLKILFKTFLVVFSRQDLYRKKMEDPISGKAGNKGTDDKND